MYALRVFFFFNCFLLIIADADESDERNAENTEKQTKIDFSLPSSTSSDQTRTSRTLFKKLHSGAAFLAGLKLGTILSKKGFELGHGKIASTHSFQVFGKSVNSAMSLAYGNAEQLLPLADEQEGDSHKRKGLQKEEKKVFRVTVVENPSNETIEIFAAEPPEQDEKKTVQNDNEIKTLRLYEGAVEETPEKNEEEEETNFIEEHNNRVKEFNKSILRRKNKVLS